VVLETKKQEPKKVVEKSVTPKKQKTKKPV
jgi:hypothetical protein